MNKRFARLGIVLAAGTAAYALNGLTPLGFARFTSGRLLTLPIALFLGPWWGLLAALMGAIDPAGLFAIVEQPDSVEAPALAAPLPVDRAALVGAAGNLSATALVDAARTVERLGAEGRTDAARAAWRPLIAEATAVMDALLRQLELRGTAA